MLIPYRFAQAPSDPLTFVRDSPVPLPSVRSLSFKWRKVRNSWDIESWTSYRLPKTSFSTSPQWQLPEGRFSRVKASASTSKGCLWIKCCQYLRLIDRYFFLLRARSFVAPLSLGMSVRLTHYLIYFLFRLQQVCFLVRSRRNESGLGSRTLNEIELNLMTLWPWVKTSIL